MKLSAIFIIGIVFISGCVSQNDNTIKIGGAFALTGAAADWGQDEVRAAELALEEFNQAGGLDGKRIELIVEDTKTDNTGTLNAVQKLINVDNVQVIIGPTWGDSFGAIVGPLGEQNKVVQMTPSGALEVAEDLTDFPYFFSTWYPQQPEIEKHMEYLKTNNFTKVVIIHDQDPFNTKFSQLYVEEAPKNSITIQNIFEVPLGTKDFRTIVTLAKTYEPNVVLIEIFEVGEIGSVLKNIKELGMNAKLMSSASTQTANLIESYGDYAENSIIYTYPDTSSATQQEFLDKFKEKYDREPVAASAGTAYDATRVVLAVIKSGASTGEEIKNALYSIKISGTIVEEVSFNSKGQISTAPFILKTVRNGQFVGLG